MYYEMLFKHMIQNVVDERYWRDKRKNRGSRGKVAVSWRIDDYSFAIARFGSFKVRHICN